MRRVLPLLLILSLLLSSCAAPAQSTPASSVTSRESPATGDADRDAVTCSLIIRCDTLLAHTEELDPEKLELVPADGLIYENDSASFTPGESVFDLLRRELTAAKIHFEFSRIPAYDTVYIEGIANLYEFDCGELSGWMYRVNGESPSIGCSEYTLTAGDVVEFLYTCDLGADLADG